MQKTLLLITVAAAAAYSVSTVLVHLQLDIRRWWNCKFAEQQNALRTTGVNPYAMTNSANVQLLIARCSTTALVSQHLVVHRLQRNRMINGQKLAADVEKE